MNERLKNLDYLFHPKSIAFVGATETFGKWGFLIFNTLIKSGWEGKLYPVNLERDSVLGFKAYPTVTDIPDDIDLAIFTIPAKNVLASVKRCIGKKVKAGLIISAGFKETGGDNIALEEELVETARQGDMVLAGPNCLGICTPSEKLFPWMPDFCPRKGTVAVVSQSGNVMNILIGGVINLGLGIAKGVSSGNEADIKVEDYFEYLADDPSVDVILAYIEGMMDPKRFIRKTKAITHRKPVVMLKGGRTSSGKSAASSHTGAMAVKDDLFTSMCRQNGIMLARTMEEAGPIAASFVNQPLPKGNRVAIITGGGGIGVLASDICAKEGLNIVALSKDLLDQLGKFLPSWWVPGNPIDLVAGLDFASVIPMMEVLIKSNEVDSIILTFLAPPKSSWDAVPEKKKKDTNHLKMLKLIGENFSIITDKFFEMAHEHNVAVFPVINLTDEKGICVAEKQGDNPVAIHQSIESACRAVGEITRYARFRERA